MRFLFIVILTIVCKSQSGFALSFDPTGFLLKPYSGLGFNLWSQAGSMKNVMGSSFDVLSNVEVHAGVRAHKYFGVELGYSRFNNNSIKADKYDVYFSSNNFYLDLLLYYPVVSVIGNTIELYGSIGVVYMGHSVDNINNAKNVISNGLWTGKFGAGLQTRLIGASSFRIGIDYYHINQSYTGGFTLPYILALKGGIDVYFF